MLLLVSGRNEKGQLGHGDTLRRDIPTLVECLQDYNIIDVACGKNHTLFLTGKIGGFCSEFVNNINCLQIHLL